MSFLNGTRFTDRAAAAAKARKEMAEKFLANSKYDPADPAVVERETKRKAILEARKVRDVERAKRKAEQEAAEAARRVVEEAARQEQLTHEALARAAEAERQREEDERLEYERKLERDARYAARKERKKKKKSAAERYGEADSSSLISSRDSGHFARNQVLRGAERGEDVEPASPGSRRSRGGRDESRSASSTAGCRLGQAGGARLSGNRLQRAT